MLRYCRSLIFELSVVIFALITFSGAAYNCMSDAMRLALSSPVARPGSWIPVTV